MTVTGQNIKRLSESIEFVAMNFGAKAIQVEPVFKSGRALSNDIAEIDPPSFVEEFRKAKQVAKAFGKTLKYSGARFNNFSNHFCKASSDSLVVTPDGLITSCYEVTENDDSRANLFIYGKVDSKNNELIFNHDKIQKLRSLSVENKIYCKNCFCKWHCAGECAAKLAVMGSPWDPSNCTRCYINQELTKDQIKDYLANAVLTNSVIGE